MYITDQFDSGNIKVVDASDPGNIQLEIKIDNQSEFYQWFHFRFQGEVGQRYTFKIINAGKSAYTDGWENYKACASYDRNEWFRTETDYDGTTLTFTIDLACPSVYFAYFAPYSYERHMDLLHWAQQDDRVEMSHLGHTLDGRDMTLLTIGNEAEAKKKVWMIARQHPGESMAEWFVEGFLETLLDESQPQSLKLLQDTVFYVVPNMNPDGSARGHLRTNAVGSNLNREWQTPSMEKSPEVYLVREKMIEKGGDVFLDIHGDEALPYNFVAGCEGIPSYDARHKELEDTFKNAYMAVSPDFQDEYGYEKDEPGQANMTVAAAWMGEQFKTLSYTIEMPFKDNADLPDEDFGWSPERSKQLGSDVMFPIAEVLKKIN